MPNKNFKIDDSNDNTTRNNGLDVLIKRMTDCAQVALPALTDPEKKKEMKKALKKYHEAATGLVIEKLSGELRSDIVQGVYDDLDLEQLAMDEVDDEQFLRLLDEFEETATKEVEKQLKEKVTMTEVDKDEQYQEMLEALNVFVNRTPRAGNDAEITPDQMEDTSQIDGVKSSPNQVRHSEGLEALTEFIPTRDPITKQLLKNPYVSKKCGHVFDYENLPWLFKSRTAQCPYPGCRVIIKKNDFVRDEDLAMKIAEKIRDQEMVYDLD